MAPEGWTATPVISKTERQTCPLMLRSGRGQFVFARVFFPNQITKLQCAAPFTDGADNRSRLADRPLHLPHSTRPDWRRFLGILHMSKLPLNAWVHIKWLDTDIKANISSLVISYGISEDLLQVIPLFLATHLLWDAALRHLFCSGSYTLCVMNSMFPQLSGHT